MKPSGEADRVLLDHIRECIGRIEEYTGGERSVFFESHLVQDAVVRNLQTLAESTQRLSRTLKDTEQSVPWRAIAGFRNVLVHGYLGIDLEAVWSVVEKDLPELSSAFERMRITHLSTERNGNLAGRIGWERWVTFATISRGGNADGPVHPMEYGLPRKAKTPEIERAS